MTSNLTKNLYQKNLFFLSYYGNPCNFLPWSDPDVQTKANIG